MNEKKELAYALYKAVYTSTGHGDLAAKSWDYVHETEQKEYFAAVEAAMAWFFEKGYLSQAGLKSVQSWEKEQAG